ncbi:MAG: hypothetical protein A49_07360 [Methyloceanibacter sp.]|nr:MAG: hypothetical protein A49_07360 [Methyloceanibacter sp.]
MKPDDFARMPVVIPPDRMVTAFDSRARRMLDRTQASRRAISLLTELRDALLPQLMSGDLRVHEAASLIAEAG